MPPVTNWERNVTIYVAIYSDLSPESESDGTTFCRLTCNHMVAYTTTNQGRPDVTRIPIDQTFTALSDPTRRQIAEFLTRREAMSVGELAAQFKASRQAVTKHLDVLCDAGLVATEWQGRKRLSSISPDAFDPIWDWLAHYGRFWTDKLENLKELIERREKS